MKNRSIVLVLAALVAVTLLAGCATPAVPAISIESAWGRMSPTVDGAGAFYFLIKNTGNGEDKLTAVKSPACGMAEIHETVKNADGTMGMNMMTEPVVVPANGQVEFKSGGMHIMCMMVKTDQFTAGNKVDLVMSFEKSGDIKVSVDIRDQ